MVILHQKSSEALKLSYRGNIIEYQLSYFFGVVVGVQLGVYINRYLFYYSVNLNMYELVHLFQHEFTFNSYCLYLPPPQWFYHTWQYKQLYGWCFRSALLLVNLGSLGCIISTYLTFDGSYSLHLEEHEVFEGSSVDSPGHLPWVYWYGKPSIV